MLESFITEKESVIILDLLESERLACKKAWLLSRTLTDKNLAEQLVCMAKQHKQNFLDLYNLVKGGEYDQL